MVKAPLIRNNDGTMLDCPLISGYAYGSRNQPPVTNPAYQSSVAKLGAHSVPDCQASATIRNNSPPTIRWHSLASLATIRNNTLALWLTLSAAAASITQRGNPGAR
jgi:hypothetical protein